MCIQSVNWTPRFFEVIRSKHQKPITVSRTLNQTDMSPKRYGHEKLTGGFLRRLFFPPSISMGVIYTFNTVTDFSLSLKTNRLDNKAIFSIKTKLFISDKILRSFLYAMWQLNITSLLFSYSTEQWCKEY